MRVGIGFDVHRFDPSRALVLGGIEIPSAPGLAGHSDADVVCHAIADALLGAAALGDLGAHFSDTDPQWKDASSIDLLKRVMTLIEESYSVVNVDATVLIEAPKLAPHRGAICEKIAHTMRIDSGAVSVKATTTEGLGTVGRAEGAACLAVVLLEESR